MLRNRVRNSKEAARLAVAFCLLSLLLAGTVAAQDRGIGLLPVSHPKYSEFYNHSFALVVGIDDYPSVPRLRYATNDAKSFTGLLESEFGFKPENVTTLLDSSATRKNIMLAFDRLRRNAKKNDRVLVFFAGHGETIQMPDGRQKGYILPYDVDTQDLITTAISTDQLNEISQLMPAKHLFFIMDACYGGLIFSRAAPLSPTASDYLEVISTRAARKALTAGGQDQTVQDNGPGGHSVFTYYLLTGLQTGAADLNGDGMITSSELDSYIAPRVTAETNRAQTPEYGILGGDTGGDFVFIPNTTASTDMVQTTIGSDPSGASVSIDGKASGVTPLTLPLSPAKHYLSVAKAGYVTSADTVLIAKAGFNNFNYNLDVAKVPVVLNANVDSAFVYLDTKEVSRIPGRTIKMMVPVGSHTIELRKDKYASASSTVDFTEGSDYNLPFVLDRTFATLVVSVQPDSSAVYVDGSLRLIGSGSVDVRIGKHELTVVKEGYETYEKGVSAEGNEANVQVALAPIVEKLSLSTTPPGAVISVDDMPNSVSPATVNLRYGRHEIKVEKPGYKPMILDENVKATTSASKNLNMSLSTQGVADEIIRMRASNIDASRWSNLTLTALSGIASIIMAVDASGTYDRYMRASNVNDIDGAWNEYQMYSTGRDFAVGATILFGLASVYSILSGVDRNAAYQEATDLDSRGVTFGDFSGVDNHFQGMAPVIADLSGGSGITPIPAGMVRMNLVPLGVTLNLPMSAGTWLRIGGAYCKLTSEVSQWQHGLHEGDPVAENANLAGVKAGLGFAISKIKLSGDYVFLFDPEQSGGNPLAPSSLYEFTLEGEAIRGLYVGVGITLFQSKVLKGVQYDSYAGTPAYDISNAGLIFYPSLVVGFGL